MSAQNRRLIVTQSKSLGFRGYNIFCTFLKRQFFKFLNNFSLFPCLYVSTIHAVQKFDIIQSWNQIIVLIYSTTTVSNNLKTAGKYLNVILIFKSLFLIRSYLLIEIFVSWDSSKENFEYVEINEKIDSTLYKG